jgi:hypothetical protein
MPDERPTAEIVPVPPTNRLLTAAEFHQLADVPPEVEWFANLSNAHTRRVYPIFNTPKNKLCLIRALLPPGSPSGTTSASCGCQTMSFLTPPGAASMPKAS